MKKYIKDKKIKKEVLKCKNTIIETSVIPHQVIKDIGENCYISKDVKIYKDTVKIGDYTYINGGKIFYAQIGKYCSIAHGVYIGSGEHYIDRVTTFPIKNKIAGIKGLVDFPEQKDTIIGNDVWIGNNVCIKQGVKIGNGAIIASGAVVTRDVEPYTIVGGVPAKLIKKRFDDEIIKALLEIEWWNWEFEKIKKVAINNEFDDIKNFINKYSNHN